MAKDQEMNVSRRNLLGAGGLVLLGAAVVSGRIQAAGIPEAASAKDASTAPPRKPTSGPDYQPVVTLNGWTLPWRMNGDWKEFHLVAEPVVREIAPGTEAYLWGYNGQSPGPTIEVVEGDKLRIFVTNKLPEGTAVHWHGQRLPNGMDGVAGLTQAEIPPGKTFLYEFQVRRSGTFMYHPHADEMVQLAMGMMGLFIVHPKDPAFRRVDRDFAFLMSAYDLEPGSHLPKVAEMTEFNLWTWNSRMFPGIDPLTVGLGDKVRLRVGNLTMTNHPIHVHGHEFKVSGTDGGWVGEERAWPEVTVDVAVGQMRSIDFIADEPGDWAVHCHKSHHTMNAMGHNIRNYIGVDLKGLAPELRKLVPAYMPMGSTGMGEMGTMEMAIPDNTVPMMTGFAQFGPVAMGGMFSVLKVRQGQKPGDYTDPGPYQHPAGTIAREVAGPIEPPQRQGSAAKTDSSDVSFRAIRSPLNPKDEH